MESRPNTQLLEEVAIGTAIVVKIYCITNRRHLPSFSSVLLLLLLRLNTTSNFGTYVAQFSKYSILGTSRSFLAKHAFISTIHISQTCVTPPYWNSCHYPCFSWPHSQEGTKWTQGSEARWLDNHIHASLEVSAPITCKVFAVADLFA